jgi:predicted transcriptional regulator
MHMVRLKKQYTVQLEDDVIERIDQLAKKLGHNRSQMMRNLLLQGLADGEMVAKTGIFSAVMFSKNILSKFKEAAIHGKIFLDKNGDLKMNK